MDQTEVARYRALLREQSQAKTSRLRPFGRWLGADRIRGDEPVASAVVEALPDAIAAPLEAAPAFPPRRPLAPLEPRPSPTLGAQPARVRERVKPAPTTSPTPAPIHEAELAAQADPPTDLAPPGAFEPPTTDPPLRLDVADDFVEPPPLGILDLLSPAVIAEYDLERPVAPAASRAFGRREGDPATEFAPAVDPTGSDPSVAPVGEPPLEWPAQVVAQSAPAPDPAPERVAASEPEAPAIVAVAIEPEPDLADLEGVALATAAAIEPEDAASPAIADEALAPVPYAADDGVVVAIASRSARAPLVRRLEPERTPAAVMRNLQTILEAERSIVDLWRSLARAAA